MNANPDTPSSGQSPTLLLRRLGEDGESHQRGIATTMLAAANVIVRAILLATDGSEYSGIVHLAVLPC